MDADTLLRTLSLCVALAGTETLHGIARTRYANPRLGKASHGDWLREAITPD